MLLRRHERRTMDPSTNPSRQYLRQIRNRGRRSLAELVGTCTEYLFMISQGKRTPSRKMAIMLELKTDGKIRAKDFDDEVRSNVA